MSIVPATAEPDPPSISRTSDAARLATGAGVALVGRLAGRSIHLVVQVAIARLLGVEAFGLYAIGWTTVRIGGLIAPLGLDQGLLRYGSIHWDGDRKLLRSLWSRALALATLAGLFIGAVLYVLASFVADTVFGKPDLVHIIRWFTPAFPLIAGLKVTAAATRISQTLKWSVYSEELAQPAANLLLLLLFSLAGWRLFGAVTATSGSFGVGFMLAVVYLRRLLPAPSSPSPESPRVAWTLLMFSLPVSLAGVCSALIMWSDVLLVGYFLPAADVGIYQAASQSSMLFTFILGGFVAIFAPMIASLHESGETARLEELFRLTTKWTLYLTVPFYLVICFASREIMVVVFGSDFAAGSTPLVILATGQLMNVAMGTVGLLLVMTGWQTRWLLYSLLMLILHIGMLWLLIPRFGLPGAAVATAVSLSALFSLGLLQVKLALGVWPYDARCLKLLLPAVLVGAAAMLIRSMGAASPAVTLGLFLISSLSIFVAALLLIGLDREDYEFLRRIQSFLRTARSA